MAVDVGSAVGYLDLDISGFLANLKTAQSEAEKTSKNIATKVGNNLTSVGKSLTSAGSTLTKTVTLPVVGLGTAAVKTSADFESAMSKVSAISGATGDDLDALNAKAQEMGAKTKFSATESAEAFTYMAMAGWKTEDMISGIDGIMNLAAADGLDLATTSDIVTDALTAFGLSAEDSSHFADVLAKASSNANTNVSMLGESFKYAAPVAGALGYSAEDTAVALGLMANAGIKGSQGGTALRTSLTKLVNPTSEAAGLMEQYGISMTNADGSMKSLGEVMDTLRGSLGNLNEAEQAQVASTIFGQEAMSGMLAIINASDSDYQKLTDSIYNADGAAQQMSETMLDNLGGQLTLLKSALEGLAIQFGEILMPYIKQFVSWLQNLVQKLQEMTPEQKEQIAKWAAFAAAIGPVLLVIGKLTTCIGSVISLFGKLSTAGTAANTVFTAVKGAIAGLSGPIIAIIAVIGTLIAVFTHLWNTNEEFRDKMTEIWGGIKEKFSGFIQGITERLEPFMSNFKAIMSALSIVWNGFCELLAPVFEGTFSVISSVLGTIFDVILGILDFFIGLFTGNWEQCWNGIKEIFGGVWDGILGIFEAIADTLLGLVDTVCGWFGTTWEDTWNGIKQFFEDIWNGIVEFFTNIINGIKDTVVTVFTAIQSFITTIWDTIKSIFANTLTNIWNNVTSVWNGIKNTISSVINGVKSVITNGLNAVKSTVSNILNGIKSKFTSVFNGVKSFVSGIVDWLKGIFNFNWKLPELKMPHFKVDGEFSLNPLSVPSFKIDWYKKAMSNGMIMDTPTIFGFDPNTGKFMAGGEAGSETIVGTHSLMEMISATVSSTVGQMMDTVSSVVGSGEGDIIIPVYIGNEALDTLVVKATDRKNYRSGGR